MTSVLKKHVARPRLESVSQSNGETVVSFSFRGVSDGGLLALPGRDSRNRARRDVQRLLQPARSLVTSRPQPLRSWRLLALVAGLAGGLAVVERLAGLPSATWPSDTVPRDLVGHLGPAARRDRSRHPVMSLVMDPADLHDPDRGILTNVLEHGRDWERPGTVAYFDDGQLKFATGVGVRIHGGGSRKTSPRQGFRLYFRREYGARQVPPNVLFGPDAQPIRHLVVHNDVRDGRHFANPLAYDIAREVGAITAGHITGTFFSERRVLRRVRPDRALRRAVLRGALGARPIDWTDEDMQSFWKWSVQHRPMSMADVAVKADVESLARWFLATAFTATRDAYQGPGSVPRLVTNTAALVLGQLGHGWQLSCVRSRQLRGPAQPCR